MPYKCLLENVYSIVVGLYQAGEYPTDCSHVSSGSLITGRNHRGSVEMYWISATVKVLV